MALDFPSSPTNGQVYGNFIYSTAKGAWQAKPITGKVTTSATAPSTPTNGDEWFNTNDGNLYVYYTDVDGSQWVQVKSDATLSSTLGNRVTSLEAASPVVMASAAARNAAFPNPVQGNSVFRSDTGWIETYYALYNASTNPGGATPAGWYPVSGNMPQAKLVRNATVFTFTNAAWNTVPNLTYWATEIPAFGGVTIETNGTLKTSLPGLYEASMGIMSGGISFAINSLKKNNMGADGVNQIGVQTAFGQSGWTGSNVKSTVKMTTNDYIFWSYYVSGTSSSYAWNNSDERGASFMHLRYVGPPLGA